MSEIQVGQINSTDGSTAITTGADGYVSFAKTQIGGRRNLIINGAMQVWQRSTSATVTSDEWVAADRFKGRTYGGSGRYTMALDTSDVPSGQTFTNAMKLTVTTTDSSNSYAYSIQQNPEGYVVAPIRAGTSDAQQFTISFWAKSSVAGTYCWSARGPGGAASYVFEYTLAANTWKKITHTVAAPTTTTPTWNYTNSQGMLLEWNIGRQTSKTTSTTEAWHDGNYLATANQTDWIANSGATFYLTGVQLEVGTVATPFEHRSYGEELALCQRYTWVIKSSSAYSLFGPVSVHDASTANAIILFPQTMRATPTLGQSGSFSIYSGDGGDGATVGGIDGNTKSPYGVVLNLSGSGFTDNSAGFLRGNNDTSASISFFAEL